MKTTPLQSIQAIFIRNAFDWLSNVTLSFLAWLSSPTLMIFYMTKKGYNSKNEDKFEYSPDFENKVDLKN